MRLIISALTACALAISALPAFSEIVENDAIKVFEGRWVQSKDPSQNGILMYLTQERSSAGEYFSIRCEEGKQSVRLAYPKRRSAKDIGLTVDGSEQRITAKFTGNTKDPHFLKGNLFGYALTFATPDAQEAFLSDVREGRMLTIEGQSLPVELKGSGQAIVEQASYCS